MTTGSTSSSNHRALPPRDDRETLSALFDGELPSDAARFALKRLDHDAEWREACGRWQLIGDALRGEATAAAPAHFAAGVMRVVHEERLAGHGAPASMPAGSVTNPARAVSPRRWLGGAALAASVAVAAVLVVRPFQNEASSSIATGPADTGVVATAASNAPAATRASDASASQPLSNSQAPVPQIAVATADPAPAPARSARAAAQGAARSSRNPVQPRQVRIETVASATTPDARDTGVSHQPFHPPADEIVTRPWPRSVLSESTAAGAFTVGFGQESAASTSLYPFEPRLPQNPQSNRPEPVEPQR